MFYRAVCRVLALSFVLGASACGGHGSAPAGVAHASNPAAAPNPAGDEPSFATPARVFPPIDRSDVTAETRDSDGGRRFIAQGLRVIESPEGALVAADEFLPGSRIASTLALPARLGAGFLFVLNTNGQALFWHAKTWTGALEPLARLDGEAERVVPGFDRVYVLRGRGAPWVALDVASGHALDLASLPPSPGYGAMAFADEWLGAVELPLRGVLATFDAGGSWHPLGLAHAELGAADGGIVVEAPGQRFLLTANGAERPLAAAAAGVPPPEAAPKQARRLPVALPFGERPLETAVLHGHVDGDGTALVAAYGSLARVSLRDGSILALAPDAYAGRAPCDAVALGAGIGFVCGELHGATNVYALGPGLTLSPKLAFDAPRRVAPNQRGALVVEGGCGSHEEGAPLHCVVPPAGAPYAVARQSVDERAVALADGGVALLRPVTRRPKAAEKSPETSDDPDAPHPAAKPAPKVDEVVGTLALVHPGAPERSVPLRLSAVDDEAARALVESGLWLDSFVEAASGDLYGWVAGSDSFVGVRVKEDGSVLVGSPEPHLDRAMLSGRFGLVVGHSGGLRETVDGGFEWTDGEFPGEPDLRPLHTSGTWSGCTRLGCSVSGWLRVGWKMGEKDRLKLAAVPEPTHLFGSGGNRWSLECHATGEQSKPALHSNPQSEDRAQSPWNPLAEVSPPARTRADYGFETGNEADLHLFRAYAWGPPGDGWVRDARWLLRVRDPYRVGDAIWSTAPSSSAWSSDVLAADAFGRSPNGPPSTWRVLSDPVRHAGLLLVSLRGSVELYLLEEGSRITRLKTQGTLGVLSSVAVAGGRFYAAALGEGHALRLYRVEHGELELLGEFPDVLGRSETPALAPAARGDGVGVWLHDVNYYLFPFDVANRRFDAPIVARASDLASMPPACSTGEDGYVVGDAISLEPNVELVGAGVSAGNGIEVRLVVSPSHVCVDALAAPLGASAEERRRPRAPVEGARSRGAISGVRTPSAEPNGDLPAQGVSTRDAGPGAPLVLDFPDGARRGFRCQD
ncbi:MAG TPA: hypothetical protein VMI54_25365 [Polyangiaceae bacterium]|nr:hypothetical protein [Polyangiaceae bacterium]